MSSVEDAAGHLPARARAFGGDRECELVSYHAPKPATVEFHHTRPVFLQNRVYGRVRYGPDLWVCPNCHDAIHAWLYWLLGEHAMPPRVGRAAKAEAERTLAWYTAELAAREGGA